MNPRISPSAELRVAWIQEPVAERFRLPERTLRYWAENGRLPVILPPLAAGLLYYAGHKGVGALKKGSFSRRRSAFSWFQGGRRGDHG